MKCELNNREELISKYMLQELPNEECTRFEEHYFRCEECYKELRSAEDALVLIKNEGKQLKEKPAITNPVTNILDKLFPSFSEPVKWGIAFSSAAVLMAVIYFSFFTVSNEFPDEIKFAEESSDSTEQIVEEIVPDKETLPKPNDKELIAVLTGPAFETNPYYEELMMENLRSSREIVEKVTSPGIGEEITTGKVSFSFTLKENLPLELKVLNNNEDVIFTSIIDQSIIPEINLAISQSALKVPGLYYWRLEDENEVYYIGKFYFLKK